MTSWGDSATGGTAGFAYDGDGRRVTKTSSVTGTTYYVYDPSGKLAMEVGGTTPSTTGPVWLTVDHLGSTRLVTNVNGCVGAHDYLPFGEEIPGASGWGRSSVPCYGSADVSEKYTGQERDSESGLDYFGARYFSGAQGRFSGVDPDINLGSHLSDPQGWNGFAYGRNNPLRYTDPTGENYTVCGVNGKDCADLTDDQYAEFLSSQGVKNISGNQLTLIGKDGARTLIGTADYYNEAVFSRVGANQIVGDAGTAVYAMARGLRMFGYLVEPLMMAAAECGTGSCDKTNLAMAFIPELDPVIEGSSLLRVSKGGTILRERAGGFAKAAEDFESLPGAERTIGNVKVKSLPDGSTAVLRSYSKDGRPTLEIQATVGKDMEIRYNP